MMLLVQSPLLIDQKFLLSFVFLFFSLTSLTSRGLTLNPGCLVFKWRSSFKVFAAVESRSPHTMQRDVGVWDSPVAINPYFKSDSWYCLLKACCFFDVEGSSSVSTGPFPLRKETF